MKRALLIISIGALFVLGVAIAGQALVYTQGVVYTPAGQPASPTSMALVATFMASVGSVLSMPFTLAAGILGLVVTLLRRRNAWVMAIVVAGLLALVGLYAMAWVLLSANTPVALVTPLALVPLVTLLYARQPEAALARAPHARSNAH